MSVIKRVAPVLLSIAPVSMLFGALSSQADWTILEIIIVSIFGFTGSGQFAVLPLVESGAGLLTIIIVTASINSRYIPIALSASSRLPDNKIVKTFTAHMLGDEAYATENETDDKWTIITIRLAIYFTWVVSSVIGVLLANYPPESVLKKEVHAGFPASIVLLYLACDQLKNLKNKWSFITLQVIVICLLISFSFIYILGGLYFWLPSIICTALFLYYKAKL